MSDERNPSSRRFLFTSNPNETSLISVYSSDTYDAIRFPTSLSISRLPAIIIIYLHVSISFVSVVFHISSADDLDDSSSLSLALSLPFPLPLCLCLCLSLSLSHSTSFSIYISFQVSNYPSLTSFSLILFQYYSPLCQFLFSSVT